MNIIRNGIGLGLAAALLVGILGGTGANAQIYPQPEGYCVISLSDPLPALDSTVTLTVTAADRAGNPLPGMSGAVQITEQPGDDAQLQPDTFTTGADGAAEVVLHTGDIPGLIRIEGSCDAVELTASVTVGSPPGPPQTGAGSAEGDSVSATTTRVTGAAGALAVVASLGVTAGVLRRRGRA